MIFCLTMQDMYHIAQATITKFDWNILLWVEAYTYTSKHYLNFCFECLAVSIDDCWTNIFLSFMLSYDLHFEKINILLFEWSENDVLRQYYWWTVDRHPKTYDYRDDFDASNNLCWVIYYFTYSVIRCQQWLWLI